MLHYPRKHLPHNIPLWIDPNKEIYFLTINCRVRHSNQLARAAISQAIFDTVAFRNDQYIWFSYLFLLMPDHAHALISFPPSGKPVRTVISKWKEWTAKTIGIEWQLDFFEHRLRHEESHREKAEYILQNPVRAGLIQKPEDWPYVWFPEGQKPEFEC